MRIVSSSISSQLLMVQRKTPQAVSYYLAQSWCTMVSEEDTASLLTSLNHGAPWYQRKTPQASLPRSIMVHHGIRGRHRKPPYLAQSWCTMVSEEDTASLLTSLNHGAPWYQRKTPQASLPRSIMVHHGITKYRLCQTTTHSSLLVDRQEFLLVDSFNSNFYS